MPDSTTLNSLPTEWVDLIANLPMKEGVAPLPESLLEFLADLRLLRGVPVRYLVPDGDRLPIESIRFFFVDPTWTDRLVDGVFAAGSIGSQDQVFSARVLSDVRRQVDERLGVRLLAARGVKATAGALQSAASVWASVTLSGFVLRSELVQRWPDLQVRAYYNEPRKDPPPPERQIATMRVERLGAFMLVALFAGVPDRIELEEPQAGVRLRLSPQDKAIPRAGALAGVQDLLNGGNSNTTGAGAFAASLVDPPFVAVFEGADSWEAMQKLRTQVKDYRKIKLPVGGGA